MKRSIGWLLVILCAALLVRPGAALAQGPAPSDDAVNAIAKQLYCPVCENIPLDVCPTTACAQWRALIGEKLSQGWSEQQIKDYFVAQYGDRVLAEPPRRGLNWAVYVMPPLFIAAAAGIVVGVLRSMRRPARGAQPQAPSAASTQAAAPADPDPDYTRRLEEELRRRR